MRFKKPKPWTPDSDRLLPADYSSYRVQAEEDSSGASHYTFIAAQPELRQPDPALVAVPYSQTELYTTG
jgi:hypothetical protein